jgi:hypothetical protein
MGRWKNQELVSALEQWKGNHRRQKRLRGVARRWAKLPMGQSFVTWVDFACEQKRLRRAAAKVVLRWKRRAVAGAMDGWTGYVAERRRLRVVADKVARRWRNLEMSGIFWYAAWWCGCGGVVVLSHAVILLPGYTRLTTRTHPTTHSGWAQRTEEQIVLRHKANIVARRWMNRTTSSVFGRWVDFVNEAGRLRFVANKVAMRWKVRAPS